MAPLPEGQRHIPCPQCGKRVLEQSDGNSSLWCRANWRQFANDPWYRRWPGPVDACDFRYVTLGKPYAQINEELAIPEGWTFTWVDFYARMKRIDATHEGE
jgi:hypothetical protein